MLYAFTGQIALFAFNFPPVNWAICAGQIISISQNTALFSLIGTTYGGNGQTNFALPDLQGRVPLCFGTGTGLQPYKLGDSGGKEGVVLSDSMFPSHNHALVASTQSGSSNTPTGLMLATPQSGLTDPTTGMIYNPAQPNQKMRDKLIKPAGTTQRPPHENMQPSLVVNYCICLSGVMPSRP